MTNREIDHALAAVIAVAVEGVDRRPGTTGGHRSIVPRRNRP